MYEYDRNNWNEDVRVDIVDNMSPQFVSFACHSEDVARIRIRATIWYSLSTEQKHRFYDLLKEQYHIFMERFYEDGEKSRDVEADIWENVIFPFLLSIVADKGLLVRQNMRPTSRRVKSNTVKFVAENEAFKGATDLRDLTDDLKAKYDNYGEDLFKQAQPIGACVELDTVEDTPDVFKGVEADLGVDNFADDIFGGLDI